MSVTWVFLTHHWMYHLSVIKKSQQQLFYLMNQEIWFINQTFWKITGLQYFTAMTWTHSTVAVFTFFKLKTLTCYLSYFIQRRKKTLIITCLNAKTLKWNFRRYIWKKIFAFTCNFYKNEKRNLKSVNIDINILYFYIETFFFFFNGKAIANEL